MAPGDDIDSDMLETCALNPNRKKEGQGAESDPDQVPEGEGKASSSGGPDGLLAGEELTLDDKDNDPYSDEPAETLAERLWGLTEMFPEPVRNGAYAFAINSQASAKIFYGFSRSLLWIVFSSSIVLFAPVIFEVERAQMEEAQRSQQKQMLLGPNTAISGGNLPLMPSVQR